MNAIDELMIDSPRAAQAAGLTYASDTQPGIRRRRCGRGFTYTCPAGRPVDSTTRTRIQALVIPPAWDDVWICPNPRGHVQATGRDTRGRKQYLYHERWRAIRDLTKFHRTIAFGEALPRLRRAARRHLNADGMTRERVLALAVRLMESTAIRIGNESYAKENDSYGLTTLTSRHVRVRGKQLRFRFRAKGGKLQEVEVTNARLAHLVKQCLELPGCELFQYRDNGDMRSLDSGEFNAYLQETMGGHFTAKDFRTWTGTVLATAFLMAEGHRDTEVARKRVVREAIRHVSLQLGNTQATARKYYIHPFVLNTYLDGTFDEILARRNVRKAWRTLHRDEQSTLKLLVEGEETGKGARPLAL